VGPGHGGDLTPRSIRHLLCGQPLRGHGEPDLAQGSGVQPGEEPRLGRGSPLAEGRAQLGERGIKVEVTDEYGIMRVPGG
jgi:hypothetical protein